MDQSKPEIGEHLTLQAVVVDCGRLEIEFFRFFNQRVDEIRLTPRPDLFTNERRNRRHVRIALQHRGDGLPVAGKLIDHRHVQVAVECQRERPGDRRCRHHQDVGVRSLAPQRRTLHDTEPVLFIDHNETQAREGDIFFEECMSPHNDLHGAPADIFEQVPPESAFLRSHEEADTHRAVTQEPPESPEMLLGEKLRRRHEDRLVAVVDRDEHRKERHHRLPASHVPLEQAVHDPRRGHVRGDFLDDLHLGARKRKRECVHKPAREGGLHPKGNASGFFPHRTPLHRELDLETEKFLVLEPAQSLPEIGPGGRPVDGLESRTRGNQTSRIGDGPGKDLRDNIAVRFPGAGDDPPEASAVEAGPGEILP